PFPPEGSARCIHKHLIQIVADRMTIACDRRINRNQKNNCSKSNKNSCNMCRYINPTKLFEPGLLHMSRLYVIHDKKIKQWPEKAIAELNVFDYLPQIKYFPARAAFYLILLF